MLRPDFKPTQKIGGFFTPKNFWKSGVKWSFRNAGFGQLLLIPNKCLASIEFSTECRSAIRRKPFMARSRLVFLLLLVEWILVSSVIASFDVPFMVAHKKVSQSQVKSGVERLTVSIDIFNEGSVTAYDVSLVDDGWPRDKFELVSGSTSKTWERLDVGAAISHSFVLETKVKVVFQGSPAVIKYRISTKTALQEAFSTPIQPLYILADKPQEKKFEWTKRLLAKYGSQASVLLLVGLFLYVLVSPSKSSASKGKKKR